MYQKQNKQSHGPNSDGNKKMEKKKTKKVCIDNGNKFF